jgi:hypothetical protein
MVVSHVRPARVNSGHNKGFGVSRGAITPAGRKRWRKPSPSAKLGTWFDGAAPEGLARLRVTIETILVQDNEPVGADLDGGRVLLSLRAGAYFNLNPMASEIWQMLAVPCQVGRIFASLSDGHDVDAQTVARDVTPFLQTLVNHRLVRVIDPRKQP